jgi:hypothetical protein
LTARKVKAVVRREEINNPMRLHILVDLHLEFEPSTLPINESCYVHQRSSHGFD